MALSNLNLLSADDYFDLVYLSIKERENPWLLAGTGFERIHNGGGDGNPTFGYGFNLAAFNASVVEAVILHAYGGSLTGQQSAGLDLILDWKTGATVFIDGAARPLTNGDIINMADVGLNGAPAAVGSSAQRAAIQSLSLNNAQATRMLDVMVKGELELVHIEGPAGSWGYEDGLDARLAEEGAPAYSTERAAILSVYYNAPVLIGPGAQEAIANDDRAQLWYEIRYNHNHYDHRGLQNRRAEEAELLGLVSQAAQDDPAAHIDEYAASLDRLFNGDDRLDRRLLNRIEERDGLDNFEDAISPELAALLQHYVLDPLGANAAPTIDFVQADMADQSAAITADSYAGAGIAGGNAASTVNLILGRGGDDLIIGLGAADYLYGGAGDDTIYGDGAGTPNGSAGHDLIDGGDGDDALYGGDGDEFIVGGAGNDLIEGGAGAERIEAGAGNDVANGGAGADDIKGAGGADTISGGAGNDSLNGGVGSDLINGEDGDDIILGDADGDIIKGAGGDDILNGGAAGDLLFGGDDADQVKGAGGDDAIIAEAGDDTIDGGLGDDTLNGGTGADVFVFRSGDGADTINDFQTGIDTIDLSAFGAAFDSIAEVMNAASDQGSDVVIDFGGDAAVVIAGLSKSDLSATDFGF